MDLNKKLEELKPYQLNCNVFDVYSYNGLTMQDLLCQFFTKINECINLSNETIDLAKWLVNEGLEIEVVKKLMIWLEDGTLENIINVDLFESFNSKIDKINNQFNSLVSVNIKDFDGDNDTEKLKKLISYVDNNLKNKNCNIIINDGDMEITEDIIISNWSNKKIDIISKIKFTNCNALEFRWLRDSAVTIMEFEGDISKENDNLSTLISNGLKFTNCNSNIVDIVKISGFRNGLMLYGKDYSNGNIRGCYCNKITYKSISKCFNAINLSDDLGNGWVNENNIYGGGIYATNGIIQGDSSITSSSSSRFHNNKFYHIEFEQIYGGDAIIFNQGRNCLVSYPRFEGSGITGDSKYIIEGLGSNGNVYLTSNYLIPLSKIILNLNANSSIVEGDIRDGVNGTKICNKVIASKNGYRYIDYSNEDSFNNTWSSDIPDNTVCLGMGDGVLLAKKDGGLVHKLVCSDVKYYKNSDYQNNFTNLSSSNGSTSPQAYVYKTGENEVVLGGLLKCSTKPSPNSVILTLPNGFEINTKAEFVVSCEVDTGNVYTATVEVEWNQVRLRKFNSNENFTNVTRLCLNGVRFKQDIKTLH